ncbi:glycerophosphoryl diester phosphodiesterase [Streptomyces qinglanensis]|uniref:Glycerophosphoryl diester phosphodiesterase n=2 Tax=Streptomyces qinglanensis TaxID=943816 RepID=A0A1H9NRY6_9ACTN|nr:glycerophosphoryl diester phosphodiesterase [Streptomyces qinglanensis]
MVSLFTLALVAAPSAPAASAGRTGPSAPEQTVSRPVAPRLSRLSGTTVTAHRGGALEVPENSMQGMAATRRRGYAHVLDADIRRLRDGTLVAMHDDTLDRTTDQHGRVGALDWKAWQKVRLTPRSSLPGQWRPERPPAAREILDRFGGDILLMLELKDPEGLPRLARLIRERHLTHSVLVESNDPQVAAAAHREGLLTAVWRSARQAAGDRPERWKDYVTMLSVDHRAAAGDVRRAVRSGITYVWSHTVNTRAARDRMLKLGCEGIVTDRPGSLAPTGVEP